jgi:hypothetical protein
MGRDLEQGARVQELLALDPRHYPQEGVLKQARRGTLRLDLEHSRPGQRRREVMRDVEAKNATTSQESAATRPLNGTVSVRAVTAPSRTDAQGSRP